MFEALHPIVTAGGIVVLAVLCSGCLLRQVVRQLPKQGLAFCLVAAGFLVSMATKPTPTNTVTFVVGEHGTRIGGGALVQQVEDGKAAEAPVVQAKAGWSFAGWDRDFTAVTEDLTVNARYTNTVYTITYEDAFRSAHANPPTFTVTDEIVFAPPAAVEGYDFAGWTPQGVAKGTTSNVTAVANWTKQPEPPPEPPEPVVTNVVEFVLDEDRLVRTGGGELEQRVETGSGAKAPEVMAKDGYRFVGWGRPFDVVTNDLTVTALWEDTSPPAADDWIGTVYVPRNDDGIPEGEIVVESGTRVAISIRGLPKGLTYDKNTKALVYDGEKMADGNYAFVVSAVNANGYRNDRVVSFATEGHGGEKDPLDWGESYCVGKSYRIDCDAFVALSAKDTLSVSGLPSGFKLVKDKDERGWAAYRIEGVPTKAGRFAVTWKETHAQANVAVKYYMIVDGTPSQYVEACADGLPPGCKTTGSGVYAAGKKVALKATAKKGLVFAGWYRDAAFESPADAGTDYRNPTLTLSELPDGRTTYYPRFIELKDDFCGEIAIAGWDGESVPEGVVLVDSESLPTVTVKGLPAGLAFDRKTNALVFDEAKMKEGDYAFVITAKNAGGYVNSKVVTFAYGTGAEEPSAAFRVGQIVREDLGFAAVTPRDRLTLKGLPKGLKLVTYREDNEDGEKLPRYALEGVPTAAGRFRVTRTSVIDGEKDSDEFYLLVDGAPSRYVEVVTDGTDGCTATGSGVVAAGATLKTSAKAGRGLVFAGWCVEEVVEGEVMRMPHDNVYAEFLGKDGDYRLAAQTWLCGTAYDAEEESFVATVPAKLVACFGTAE